LGAPPVTLATQSKASSTLRSYIIDIDRSEFMRTVPAREFIKTAFGSDESSE